MAFLLDRFSTVQSAIDTLGVLAHAVLALLAVYSAWIVRRNHAHLKELLKMPKKGAKDVTARRNKEAADTEGEDLFGALGPGEFGNLPQNLEAALGAVCRLACRDGGYFGVSVTDDGGSLRLAIRAGKFHADKRFYRATEFEAALAKAFSRMGEITRSKETS